MSPIEEIIDIARWAPSGDNAQPWRFRLIDDDTVIVTVKDDSGDNVYEYRNAEPTLLSAGMLLESMRIAATAFSRQVSWTYEGRNNSNYKIRISLEQRSGIEVDPLYSYLPIRSVNRRPYKRRRLSPDSKKRLSDALGNQLTLKLYEQFGERWRFSRLNARATDIRLRIPETFSIHRRIIDWERNQSPVGIPARAVGLDPLTLRIMRWAMQRWSRTQLLNHLGGTFTAALQMDYVPGLCSAAFFTIAMSGGVSPEHRISALLQAGESIQRFWLTATKLGLAVQPGLATLAFAHYGKMSVPFTTDLSARRSSKRLASSLERALRATAGECIFIGRIGWPLAETKICRSTRLPLAELIES